MKDFFKSLGSILILIGVALLAFYYFGNAPTNAILATAAVIMVVGCITHILINRRID